MGLLGGSFNPAHGGHLHISRLAIQKLGLDQIWWLVSPQNPLKPVSGMMRLEQRVETAKTAATDPRIRVTDIEAQLGTQFTLDTLNSLKQLFPNNKFVWLMGADNLAQMPHWRRWKALMNAVPIAVLGRPTYSLRALNSLAAQRFRRQRLRAHRTRGLVYGKPATWCFISGPLHPGSATEIRRVNVED